MCIGTGWKDGYILCYEAMSELLLVMLLGWIAKQLGSKIEDIEDQSEF